jgi:hypothetical protein
MPDAIRLKMDIGEKKRKKKREERFKKIQKRN